MLHPEDDEGRHLDLAVYGELLTHPEHFEPLVKGARAREVVIDEVQPTLTRAA